MYQVKINPHWEIQRESGDPVDTTVLLRLLTEIQQTGSIAQAAEAINMSYRYAWGLLRKAENLFNNPLIESSKGRGTLLTPLAQKLIWADRRVAARLSPLLDSLASELENELLKTITIKPKAVRLEASHGFAVATLLRHLSAAKLPVELHYRNSTDSVAALSRKECDLAGFHVPIGKFEQAVVKHYSQWLHSQSHCLLHLAVREIGLFIAQSNPKGIHGLQDLTRHDLHFVNRQSGSGTRMMLELMLADASISPNDINGFESEELTHSAVAAFIASGMGDVGLGVKTAAHHFGLDFIPLAHERYFFALSKESLEEPLIKQVIQIIQSPGFCAEVNTLAGYNSAETGKIQTLSEAFKKRR